MNVRLKHDLAFTAAVYYGDRVRMNNYNLRLWMTTACTDAHDHNTAFERIKHFVYVELDSTVFINAEHHDQCRALGVAGLDITTMPGEPVDQLVGLMLYYKLNAITEGRMMIEETELASVLGENVTYLHASNEHTSMGTQPDWWQDPDVIHCDLELMHTDKVLTLPSPAQWRDLDLSWTVTDSAPVTGNTVVFADFKKCDDTK
jgi:hypothetical protein